MNQHRNMCPTHKCALVRDNLLKIGDDSPIEQHNRVEMSAEIFKDSRPICLLFICSLIHLSNLL